MRKTSTVISPAMAVPMPAAVDMLATVKVWPVTCRAATEPMKAIGSAIITCNDRFAERNMV